MEYRAVSILIIGTELTRGIIADKHGAMMASFLSNLGFTVRNITIVPDDGSIVGMLGEEVRRSDVVLVTGGLGPTSDDMTRSAFARLAGVPLVQSREVLDRLKARIGDRVRGANMVQTMFPEGFAAIDNPEGTAAGFWGIIRDGEREVVCVAMPGPPREMDPMFQKDVLPRLAALRGHEDFERDEYSAFLTAEAKIEELCESVGIPGVSWGTRFQDFRISLYLSGQQEARRAFAGKLSALMGPSLLVPGDREAVSLLEEVLVRDGLTVCTAESCTGGLLGKLLTDRPGSSAWYWGGAVTYSNEAKRVILSVPGDILSTVGPVSSECAIAMAEGIRRVSGASLALSTTGYAGPTGEEVGKVWFGFAAPGHESQAVCLRVSALSRSSIRRRAAVASFLLAVSFLEGRRLLDIVTLWQYI